MIPWVAILKHAPTILAAADALRVRTTRRPAADKTAGTDERLASLEQRSIESAQLLQDIAKQIQALIVAQEMTTRQARMALVVAIAAGIVAIGTAILAVF